MYKDILFWWITLYCLWILFYTIYSCIKLYRHYKDMKARGLKVTFNFRLAFRRLVENWMLWLVIYLFISLVLAIASVLIIGLFRLLF